MRAWGSARAEFSRQSCAEGAGLCRTAWDGGAAFIAERRSHDLFSDLVCISRSAIAAEILPLSSQRPWVAGMSLLNHHVAKPQRLVLPVFLFSLPTCSVLRRSLMVKLASYLALDAVRSVGVKDASQASPPSNVPSAPSSPQILLHLDLFLTLSSFLFSHVPLE